MPATRPQMRAPRQTGAHSAVLRPAKDFLDRGTAVALVVLDNPMLNHKRTSWLFYESQILKPSATPECVYPLPDLRRAYFAFRWSRRRTDLFDLPRGDSRSNLSRPSPAETALIAME